jgi:DNA-binding transcriptional MerR regulator
MQLMTISEAAGLLNVSSNTLRSWEQRFGFPVAQRSAGGHRRFVHGEISALKEGLGQGLSISSAVSRARDDISSDSRAVAAAVRGFDAPRADRAVEAALSLCSLERVIEEVIVPALEQVAEHDSIGSAAWAFAAQWACDWFSRARRLFVAPFRPFSIVIADASRDSLDAHAPSIRALELLLARGGATVLSVPASCALGVREMVAGRDVDVIVLAGEHLDDDAVARWVYAARRGSPAELPVAVYKRSAGAATARVAGIGKLPDDPVRAARAVLQHLHARDPFEQRSPAQYSVTVLGEREQPNRARTPAHQARRRAPATPRRRALAA